MTCNIIITIICCPPQCQLAVEGLELAVLIVFVDVRPPFKIGWRKNSDRKLNRRKNQQ